MSEPKAKIQAILSVVVSPKDDDCREKLQRALDEIVQQDPNVVVKAGSSGELAVLCGISESHLEDICDKISREYEIQLNIGEPKVIYLETIRKMAAAEGKYIRQVGGSGNYGHCKLRIEPNRSGEGYEFVNAISGGSLPLEFVKPIEKGVRNGMALGILAGYPLADIKVTLVAGNCHEVDSNAMAFEFAGSIALKAAARKASPVVLEPAMAVELTVPERYSSAIAGDISARRGRVERTERLDGLQIIHGVVPLAEMLRSSARGQPKYSMRFAGYEAVHHGGWHGSDGEGVTADKPIRPNAGSCLTSAIPDSEPE